MTWKHLLHYWLFVRGIHQWLLVSTNKGPPVMRGFDVFLVVNLNKLFNSQSLVIWVVKTLMWHHCNTGSSWYQQPLHWIHQINMSLSCTRKDFNHLCHLTGERWLLFFFQPRFLFLSAVIHVLPESTIVLIKDTPYVTFMGKVWSTCSGGLRKNWLLCNDNKVLFHLPWYWDHSKDPSPHLSNRHMLRLFLVVGKAHWPKDCLNIPIIFFLNLCFKRN